MVYIRDLIVNPKDLPIETRTLFCTPNLNHFDRCKIAAFNGVNPEFV